jgi:hypothetical protein
MLNVVNTNTVDDLLHIRQEIKIQGCQVWRAWGAIASSAPLNPAPWKWLIKKVHNSVGVVRRSTILLQDHIIINLVYRKQFNMLR